jgi:hypothetical protein
LPRERVVAGESLLTREEKVVTLNFALKRIRKNEANLLDSEEAMQ